MNSNNIFFFRGRVSSTLFYDQIKNQLQPFLVVWANNFVKALK